MVGIAHPTTINYQLSTINYPLSAIKRARYSTIVNPVLSKTLHCAMIASIRSVRQGPLGEFLIFIWGRVAHLSSYQLSTINYQL